MVVDLAISGLYALAWLVLGWSAALKSTLLNFTANPWLLVLGFGAVFGGVYTLLNLPLSYQVSSCRTAMISHKLSKDG
jgi:hypothetical protein